MSSPMVLDASAAIEAVLGRAGWTFGEDFHAHAGLDIEVLAVLRRKALHGGARPHLVREALDDFRELRITRHPVSRLIPRIWTLRNDVSAYDAGYVALAEALGIPLLTFDRRLAKTASRYCDVVAI